MNSCFSHVRPHVNSVWRCKRFDHFEFDPF